MSSNSTNSTTVLEDPPGEYNFTCCINTDYQTVAYNPIPDAYVITNHPQPACCCLESFSHVLADPRNFLINISTDADLAGGNNTRWQFGDTGPWNFTGNALLPGILRWCNCSLSLFGIEATPNITYDPANGVYLTTTNDSVLTTTTTLIPGGPDTWTLRAPLFQCVNTTYVPPWVPPMLNYSWPVLRDLADLDLNFSR